MEIIYKNITCSNCKKTGNYRSPSYFCMYCGRKTIYFVEDVQKK